MDGNHRKVGGFFYVRESPKYAQIYSAKRLTLGKKK